MVGVTYFCILFVLIFNLDLPLVTAVTDYNISYGESFVPHDFSLLKNTLEEGDRRLVHLQVLFRHGMRAPDQSYPMNPNPESSWRQGLGQLTQHGKYQEYVLGKQMRWMYRDFVTSSPAEVEVFSSDMPRCMMSALCYVTAMYQPTKKWEIIPDFRWQPIPVQLLAFGKDPYLGRASQCAAAKAEIAKLEQTAFGKNFLQQHKEFLEYLKYNSGLRIKSWTDVATLFDVLNMDKTYNFIVPEWALRYWDEMKKMTDLSSYLVTLSKRYQRLRAGPILGLIADKMQQKISHKLNKIVSLYCGHSKNLAVVMTALQVFNKIEPPFCSSLIFELYEEFKGYSVRLLYMNSSTPENGDQTPHVLRLPSCDEYCPFEVFKRMVEPLIPHNWEEECKE